jgi:hypothetical protein
MCLCEFHISINFDTFDTLDTLDTLDLTLAAMREDL